MSLGAWEVLRKTKPEIQLPKFMEISPESKNCFALTCRVVLRCSVYILILTHLYVTVATYICCSLIAWQDAYVTMLQVFFLFLEMKSFTLSPKR
jgi:hypothetical protein